MTSKTQQVINHIQDNIHWQIYKKGERIPAVRELAKTLNVSAYTVSQAYDKLVAQGIIYAKQGSGYYVSLPTQQILAKVDVPVLNQNVLDTGWLLQHLFNDFPASHCSGSGLLSPEWLYPQNHIIKAHKKVSQSMNFVYGYGNLQGYLPLRQQLSRQLADINILAHPDAMLTTSGVSSAIETIARAMCQSGDYVLVDDPTWFWIIGCLQQLGLTVIGVNRNSHGVDIAQLQQILESYRPKLYITNSVLHNPTSFNLPPNNIFEVLRLMAEYDCYIVEDDVYRYFIEDNNVMRYATLDGLQRVFYVTGVSKVLGGNWRVGLVCCPQAKLEAVLRQKMLTNMTCPELTERTICEIWQDNAYKKHLLTMQRRLRDAHETLKKSINEIGLVYPNHTMQGLFVWLNVGVDSKALALQAYKDGWIVAPSHLFSPTAKSNTHIRPLSDIMTYSTSINITHNSQANTAVLLGLLSVFAFSLTLPFSKIAVQVLTGLEVGLLRSLIGGVMAMIILLIKHCALPNRQQIIRLYLGSLGIIYGFPIFSSLAMKTVPVSHGAIVLAILPLSTAMFGVRLSKKVMPLAFWIWSIVGALLVIGYVVMTKDLQSLVLGDIYLALAVILAGFGYAQSGQLSQGMFGWQVICWMLVLNFPIILGLSLAFVDFSHINMMKASHIGALLFLASVSGLFGFFSWNKALAMGGIATISQLQLLQTFLTYGVAVLFMGEQWNWLSLIICLLVVATVYQTQKTARQVS